jgi:DUF971 family protein
MIIIAPPKKGFNEYKIINNEYAEFYINSEKWGFFTILIDLDDLERLIEADYSWHIAERDGYFHVRTSIYGRDENGKYKLMKIPFLQRWIMRVDDGHGHVVDHENHDPYDNRKINLRVTSDSYNIRNRKGKNKNNSSGYRNVSRIRDEWVVQLQKDGKNQIWRGFANEHEAGSFAKKMRHELYGEFEGED